MNIVIAFDMDGTLTDTLPSITNALNVALQHFKRDVYTEEQVRLMVGFGAHELINKALPHTDDNTKQ